MRVVPGVVVDDDCPVPHGCDLVSVVPPRHDLGVRLGVVAEPVVGLTEVVQDLQCMSGCCEGLLFAVCVRCAWVSQARQNVTGNGGTPITSGLAAGPGLVVFYRSRLGFRFQGLSVTLFNACRTVADLTGAVQLRIRGLYRSGCAVPGTRDQCAILSDLSPSQPFQEVFVNTRLW